MKPIISLDEIKKIDNVVFVDCRHFLNNPKLGRTKFDESHIPNSFFMDANQDLSSPKKIEQRKYGRHPLPEKNIFVKNLSNIGVNSNTSLISYDDVGGVFAARFWWMCKWIGHTNCAVLDGGINSWLKDKKSLSSDIKPNHQGNIVLKSSLSCEWKYEQIKAWIDHGSNTEICTLIDARAPERFEGREEPIDIKAGHVPGAVNRPFTENLTPDGLFKSKEKLREEFLSIISNNNPNSVVHMCGSGITACHNLISMEFAELYGSSLYVGSWSEWCNKT